MRTTSNMKRAKSHNLLVILIEIIYNYRKEWRTIDQNKKFISL